MCPPFPSVSDSHPSLYLPTTRFPHIISISPALSLNLMEIREAGEGEQEKKEKMVRTLACPCGISVKTKTFSSRFAIQFIKRKKDLTCHIPFISLCVFVNLSLCLTLFAFAQLFDTNISSTQSIRFYSIILCCQYMNKNHQHEIFMVD